MKYKQLPSEKLIKKLMATSFESPSKNRSVYNWADSMIKHIRFLENERIKLVQKYGERDKEGTLNVTKDNMGKFFSEFNEILEMEIDDKIKDNPLKENWFDDEVCSYPKNKDLWISPNEISFLVNL